MNQKDWVEYFEAINGRKPSMQEFQEAREKGEFVVERKETPTPTTEAQVPAQEAPTAPSAPLSQESTAFVPPQPSAKTLHPVPRPKRSTLSFNKPTKFGLAVVAIVTAITLVWIFFFCAEVGRRNRILTNDRFLSHSLSIPNFIGKNDSSLGKNMVKWIRCNEEV